jgi:hypothetical protein
MIRGRAGYAEAQLLLLIFKDQAANLHALEEIAN